MVGVIRTTPTSCLSGRCNEPARDGENEHTAVVSPVDFRLEQSPARFEGGEGLKE